MKSDLTTCQHCSLLLKWQKNDHRIQKLALIQSAPRILTSTPTLTCGGAVLWYTHTDVCLPLLAVWCVAVTQLSGDVGDYVYNRRIISETKLG